MYISMYISKNPNKKPTMSTMSTMSTASTIPNTSIPSNNDSFINVMNYNSSLQTQDSIINNNNNVKTDEVLSESEFIYNNSRPFPNKNIKPFQPEPEKVKVQEKFIDESQTKKQNDFITQVDQPDRSGYDVTGCRYDMKNSPQNLTQYGPPLAQCSAYNMNQLQTCGTIFYPLNG